MLITWNIKYKWCRLLAYDWWMKERWRGFHPRFDELKDLILLIVQIKLSLEYFYFWKVGLFHFHIKRLIHGYLLSKKLTQKQWRRQQATGRQKSMKSLLSDIRFIISIVWKLVCGCQRTLQVGASEVNVFIQFHPRWLGKGLALRFISHVDILYCMLYGVYLQ